MEAFGNMDLDNDKSLTKDEVEAANLLVSVSFRWLFVLNPSWCLQVKEYLKVEYKKEGKPREESFFDKVVEDIFRKNDNDKNGQISVKEYNIYRHDEL